RALPAPPSSPLFPYTTLFRSRVSGRPRDRIGPTTRLDELGFDSLMLAELAVALEEAGAAIGEEDLGGGGTTIAELSRLAAAGRRKDKTRPRAAPPPRQLPGPPGPGGVGRAALPPGPPVTSGRRVAREGAARA